MRACFGTPIRWRDGPPLLPSEPQVPGAREAVQEMLHRETRQVPRPSGGRCHGPSRQRKRGARFWRRVAAVSRAGPCGVSVVLRSEGLASNGFIINPRRRFVTRGGSRDGAQSAARDGGISGRLCHGDMG